MVIAWRIVADGARRGILGRRDAAHRPSTCDVTRQGYCEDTDGYSSRLKVTINESGSLPIVVKRADALNSNRTDKKQSFGDKVKAVESLLGKDET